MKRLFQKAPGRVGFSGSAVDAATIRYPWSFPVTFLSVFQHLPQPAPILRWFHTLFSASSPSRVTSQSSTLRLHLDIPPPRLPFPFSLHHGQIFCACSVLTSACCPLPHPPHTSNRGTLPALSSAPLSPSAAWLPQSV